jgi:hypothetical protein
VSKIGRDNTDKNRGEPLQKTMKKKLAGRQIVFLISLWVIATLWLLFSPSWRYQFFVQEGKPLEVLEQLLKETGGIRHNIEDLKYWSENIEVHEEGEIYAIWGWAFIDADKNVSQLDFSRFIILNNQDTSFVFPTEVYPRPGVQEYFQELGLGDLTPSGFYSVISLHSLPVGEYQVGLLFKHHQDSLHNHYHLTNKLLLRTPNHLFLKPNSK